MLFFLCREKQQKERLKNISPTLWVRCLSIWLFYKYFTPSGGFQKNMGNISETLRLRRQVTRKGIEKISSTRWVFHKHHPSEGTPLASGSFPVAEKWIECRCLVRWDWPWNAF